MSTHAPPTSGVSLALISTRCICRIGQCERSALCRLFPPPMRPAQALRLAHGTYSVTFASPSMYTEAWSRFPYSARLGDQALCREFVPSEVDPSYVDWFRGCSHPYILPGEGLSAGFGPAESRSKYVSFFNLFVFYYVFMLFRCCLISCSNPFSLFFTVSK